MKKMFNRVMALVLSLVMVLSLAACGEKVDPTDAPTDAPKTTDAPKESDAPKETEAAEFDPRSITEGVTLTVAVPANEAGLVIDWNTNETTLMLEEEFGVDLIFEAYPSADFADKINVMVNGGDELPDIIMNLGTKDLTGYANWAAAGAIIPLNEYYENPDYAKYINIGSEASGVDIPSMLKDAEGKIWSIGERKEEIRSVSKENPYSRRNVTLLEYGCKFVKIGYFNKSGLKRWVLSKDCCNSHSLILAS